MCCVDWPVLSAELWGSWSLFSRILNLPKTKVPQFFSLPRAYFHTVCRLPIIPRQPIVNWVRPAGRAGQQPISDLSIKWLRLSYAISIAELPCTVSELICRRLGSDRPIRITTCVRRTGSTNRRSSISADVGSYLVLYHILMAACGGETCHCSSWSGHFSLVQLHTNTSKVVDVWTPSIVWGAITFTWNY